MNTRNLAILACVSMFYLAGCGGGSEQEQEQQLSWEEFRAQAYREPDTGVFIVNGDEPILNEAGLREFYDRMIDQHASAAEQEGLGQAQQPLTVRNITGGPNHWGIPAARDLTYCINATSFGGNYAAVMNAMHTAAADWSATGANLQFSHNSALDTNCTNSTGVVFNVRMVTGQSYFARAFFPDFPRNTREILINTSAFGTISPATVTLAGLLRHELGHVLGFRHEHIHAPQFFAPCLEIDPAWRQLTAYDSASVMHYPNCNGATNTGDLDLTALDAVGVRAVYPVALLGNQSIAAGQTISSSDGRFTLAMQADGNLVYYWNGQGALWSTVTGGSQGKSAWMQYDGNFVLYTTPTPTVGNYLWTSNSSGYPGAYLAIQNDGNLVVYDGTGITPLWNSGTGGH